MFLKLNALFLCVALFLLVFSRERVNAQYNPAPFVTDEKTESKSSKTILVSIVPEYYSPQDGVSISDLIKRSLESNQELIAARMEVNKAQARHKQATLRANPTLEIEQSSGNFLGYPGGEQYSVGATFPLEIYGQRKARISLAEIETKASEAEIRNRERVLVSQLLINYAEALAALRELNITEQLLELDLQTTRFVQIRVSEGDAAPLELNLLMAEAERLRSRRHLVEARLKTALAQIKILAGIPFEEQLKLREQLDSAVLPVQPVSQDSAVEIALKTRPDILLVNIEEQLALAGLKLVKANSKPDFSAYTRYTTGRLGFNNAVTGPYQSWDSTLAVGISIAVPIFNRNQGAKAEAEIAIKQAQNRRDFAEKVVRGEILATYQQLESAKQAVTTLETSALPRANQNVETFRQVYQIGEIKITDLINEQRRLLDATRDLTEALTLRYRAQVNLNIALGASGLLPESK